MIRLQTERLHLKPLQVTDAPFIFQLVNQKSWLTYIGDKQVHNLNDAVAYIENGPQTMYRDHGCGLRLVTLKDDTPIGLCGMIRRDNLPLDDLGYALLDDYAGFGYAFESAKATLQEAEQTRNQIAAITSPDNQASIRLLQKLQFEQVDALPGQSPASVDVNTAYFLRTCPSG